MTLPQLEEIFASQLDQPQLYYMLQTATAISVIRYSLVDHTLAELLPVLDALTYVPDQGTYPLFREKT